MLECDRVPLRARGCGRVRLRVAACDRVQLSAAACGQGEAACGLMLRKDLKDVLRCDPLPTVKWVRP